MNKDLFKTELKQLVNQHSMESGSNTPDFLLADYLCACLDAYDSTVNAREKWYGRDATPAVKAPPTPDKNWLEMNQETDPASPT